jgi:hypothetical protein
MTDEHPKEHLLDLWLTWAFATEALLAIPDSNLDQMFATAKARAADPARWPDQKRRDTLERATSGQLVEWIFNTDFHDDHRTRHVREQMADVPDLDMPPREED